MQFNPTHDDDETNSPETALSESQEIMVGNSGRAILLGDELDLDSVHAPHYPTKGGACPSWLRSLSPKMKGLLGVTAIVLLAFLGVLIAGVTRLDNNDSAGSRSIQSDKNAVTNPIEDTAIPAPQRSHSPTPKPAPSTPNEAVSEVNIMLPDFLERTVPNFADGLNADEQQDWDILEEHIESTIFAAFSDRLPEGYSLKSVQIEKFDDYDTTSFRKRRRRERRHLQNNSESVHNVLYSSSVTVDCETSDCSKANGIVSDITSDLSQLDFLEIVVETSSPVASVVSSPTESPAASILAPTTPAPSVLVTLEPTTSPTQTLTNATMEPLPLLIREEVCTVDSPCGKCDGKLQ